MNMRQGSPGGRRPRGGRHGSNGDRNDRGNGGGPSGPRGDNGRPRSAASLRHQTFDSNGPDVRVRGNAWQVYEKYQALARDAQSSGDRVLAESYLQHAEHYYRITEAINEATVAEQRQRGFNPAAPFGSQPDVPTNYYTPDGQLMGSPVPQQASPASDGAMPATDMTMAQAEEPAQAQVERKVPPPSPFFATDEETDTDSDSGPQKLVAGR